MLLIVVPPRTIRGSRGKGGGAIPHGISRGIARFAFLLILVHVRTLPRHVSAPTNA
jgi:hypothetical protein